MRETLVRVRWEPISGHSDRSWHSVHALYAYLGLEQEILYVGKAGRSTVRERWRYTTKQKLWDAMNYQLGQTEHSVVVGSLHLQKGRRYSEPLLSDVESLLIFAIKPKLNKQCMKSRRPRLGLEVTCDGAWPGPVRLVDRGRQISSYWPD